MSKDKLTHSEKVLGAVSKGNGYTVYEDIDFSTGETKYRKVYTGGGSGGAIPWWLVLVPTFGASFFDFFNNYDVSEILLILGSLFFLLYTLKNAESKLLKFLIPIILLITTCSTLLNPIFTEWEKSTWIPTNFNHTEPYTTDTVISKIELFGAFANINGNWTLLNTKIKEKKGNEFLEARSLNDKRLKFSQNGLTSYDIKFKKVLNTLKSYPESFKGNWEGSFSKYGVRHKINISIDITGGMNIIDYKIYEKNKLKEHFRVEEKDLNLYLVDNNTYIFNKEINKDDYKHVSLAYLNNSLIYNRPDTGELIKLKKI